MKWLITGGAGFIGRALISRLISEGEHDVRVLDNLSVGSRDELAEVMDFKERRAPAITGFDGEGHELVVGDIRDTETMLGAAISVDVIVHLAANTGVPKSVSFPRLDMEANVLGTFNALEAARRHSVPRFVFASSGAPAGVVEPPIHEELPAHPISPYGASKLAGEGYCSAYYHSFGVDTVALRFGNVYGPGSAKKTSVVAKFIRHAISGKTVEIYGDGQQTRDFIYIDDLVDAIFKAATIDRVGGEVFQIASATELTINELVSYLSTALEHYGLALDVKNTQPRSGDMLRNYSDTRKAEDILGWRVTTTLEDGLKNTVEDLCLRHKVS